MGAIFRPAALMISAKKSLLYHFCPSPQPFLLSLGPCVPTVGTPRGRFSAYVLGDIARREISGARYPWREWIGASLYPFSKLSFSLPASTVWPSTERERLESGTYSFCTRSRVSDWASDVKRSLAHAELSLLFVQVPVPWSADLLFGEFRRLFLPLKEFSMFAQNNQRPLNRFPHGRLLRPKKVGLLISQF